MTPDKLNSIITKFKQKPDSRQRYALLLWYSKKALPFPAEEMKAKNKIPGCTSRTFLLSELRDGKVFYRGTSDSAFALGLIALLCDGLNGLSPNEILEIKPDFIQDSGLKISLTPSRSNGFYHIFSAMQEQARLKSLPTGQL